jgi:putative heme-binding domain-containing protein
LPEPIAGSRIPQNWNEDHLLPRRWDANGHAAGILAPGGWICNVDPSGKLWDVFSMGYRNQYDIAFNADGELFTYDADMEWDFGSPWYRPTRVCHATSGSEFGWRSGTGKWPTYYEDSLPPAVEIGPGSPTGIVFGRGAKFPASYQQALFILDWTYSTIYSIELTPDGASYRGKKTDFVTGTPLPVTDATIGSDGAFYFAAGGRGTESSLYRVTYVGSESTAPVIGDDSAGKDLRMLRHRLEEWHGRAGGDLNMMLTNLSHEDRFIRYAARIALESQPIDGWRAKAFSEKNPKGLINAMLAVARQGDAGDLNKLVETLMKLDFNSLSDSDQLAWLRTCEVAFARHGEPLEQWREALIERLDAIYPSPSYPLNAELVQLLVYLRSPSVVSKTIRLMGELGPEPIPDWGDLVARNARYGGTVGKMLADMPPVRAIHFAFVLRNAKSGWTIEDRKRYFEFFLEAAKHPGGNSYAKFLMQFRDDAIATCSPAEQILLESITNQSLIATPMASTPPKGPGRVWTKSEALAAIGGELEKQDFNQGRNLYHATSCSKCHRIGGEGGAIGPDLSTAAKKFSIADMLDAIIEPSKAISDQYGSHQVLTQDGTVLVGRTVEIGDEYYIYTVDTQAKPIVLKKNDVEQITPSKLSQMPVGLIDSLNPDELKDLIAYLMASGDPKAKLYK